MNRSALSYPMGRILDADIGGSADLQTDVMRFMAILSLCLVAIFALVQSLPMEPQPLAEPVPDSSPPVTTDNVEPPPSPAAPAPKPEALARPAVAPPRKLPPAPAYSPIDEPTAPPSPLASTKAPMPTPEAASAPAGLDPPQQEGFVLRFESDSALFELVEDGIVDLFAMRADETRRLSFRQGSPTFWPASQPRQFHEMDESTVPTAIVAALRGTRGEIQWGVTLPNDMRAELGRYLREHRGGTLIIERGGALRLDP